MKYVEVVAATGNVDTVRAIAEQYQALDFRLGPTPVPEQNQNLEGNADNRQLMRLLVPKSRLQAVLDALQAQLGTQQGTHIVVMEVETHLPAPEEEKERQEKPKGLSREALYKEVSEGIQGGPNYLVLVSLSTLVAAIGLLKNNVAVVIGAMVIAPLLAPNLALSLGTTLGDLKLVRRSIFILLLGVGLAVLLSFLIGLTWTGSFDSAELLGRTDAGLDSAALALASGAAAAMSLSSGLSSTLVGVMVAVALLPPAATIGIMLSQGALGLAGGAGLLLAINIVCVNLASKIVFLARRIHPRTSLEKEKARAAMPIYLMGWLIALSLLLLAVWTRQQLA